MIADEVATQCAARVGQTIREKYTLDALLGIGGMAAVYAATHRNGSRAALKMLHSELSRIPEIRGRFLREGYVANKVGHADVVRIMDDDVTPDGCAYLVMELLQGQTLDARRQQAGGKLPASEAVNHALRILDILVAAHDNGIIHRDIKPENVFLCRDGSLKLMDFGIARLMDGSSKTRSGAVIGTPAFMSPEQAAGQTKLIDARSDIWAVGALLFLLMSGEEVHPARTDQEQMIYAATRPARTLASAARDASPEIVHVVDIALAFEMEQRWQAARAMRNALATAAEHAGVHVPSQRRLVLEEEPVSGTERVSSTSGRTLILGSGGPDDRDR